MTDKELIIALDLLRSPHVTWKSGYRSKLGKLQQEALGKGLIELHSSETYRMTAKGWAVARSEQ